MKAGNVLVLYAGAFLMCTLEILGTPVRNLQNDESELQYLLQTRSAVDKDKKIAKILSLHDLADPELLSYIEDHKRKLHLEEPTARGVRTTETKKSKCKGKKTASKKLEPPRKYEPPHHDIFQSFNRPLKINRDCIVGDLILTPEECISFMSKK